MSQLLDVHCLEFFVANNKVRVANHLLYLCAWMAVVVLAESSVISGSLLITIALLLIVGLGFFLRYLGLRTRSIGRLTYSENEIAFQRNSEEDQKIPFKAINSIHSEGCTIYINTGNRYLRFEIVPKDVGGIDAFVNQCSYKNKSD